MANLLVVDPQVERAAALVEMIRQSAHTAHCVSDADATFAALDNELFDLVVLAAELADERGGSLFERMLERWPGLPVVALVAPEEERKHAELLRAGAVDILTPPLVAEGVRFVLSKALSGASQLAAKPPRTPSHSSGLLGESESMHKVRELLRRT